jgi:uncharacterized glyoxalase superfamily protein PhnB
MGGPKRRNQPERYTPFVLNFVETFLKHIDRKLFGYYYVHIKHQRRPIMSKYPKFTMSFSIGSTNEERLDAFELYRQAFNAEKLSEGTPPGGNDIHIMMKIYGLEILLGPGNKIGTDFDNVLSCEIRFDKEDDVRKAYDVLIREGQNYSLEGPFPWAKLLGLVTDKYGIGWALYFEEKNK